LIGQILIEKGYLTPGQLEEACRNQVSLGAAYEAVGVGRPLLGEILWTQGYVTWGQIEEALRLQEGHLPSSPSAPNPSL
jgi:hypothetical protein